MPHINHTCLVSLVAYAAKEDNIANQPVFIQELSSTLEKAYGTLLNSVKPRNANCRMCQIAHKINEVTERAQYLQINENPESSQNMPGAFPDSSDIFCQGLEKDCRSLIQTVNSIIEEDCNRPFPQNTPVGAADIVLCNACDVENDIAGDSGVETSYQDGDHPVRSENSKPEGASGDLIYNFWKSHPERPTIAQIVRVFAALPSSQKTRPSFTAVPSPSPATMPSFPTTFQSLITALDEQTLSSPVINEVTVDFIGEMLDLLEHDITISELSTSDFELILDVLLDLLRNNALANSGVQDARRLLFKLIIMRDVVPRSLFINDAITEIDLAEITTGGFGKVLRGRYAGQLVALKVLDKVRHQESSLQKDLCREALTWRSISHPFILPFLGIYKDKSTLHLVSPFMMNGTLTRWRQTQRPDVVEIHRVMLEVAEAIQYLHSEGMVHGDLHGGNVLIDSEFHCKIADFGLTRYSEATVVWTTKALVLHYAAPELFGMCSECDQKGYDGCHHGHRTTKTLETDVYAFGCLYYETFFDAIPFQGRTLFQIMRYVISGTRPERLKSPRIEEKTWDLIQECWMPKPWERPTMDEIVETMTLPTEIGGAFVRRAVVRTRTC